MADVRDLIPQDDKLHRQIMGLWTAVFSKTITDIKELAYVVVPDIDPYSLWGPCPWMPRCEDKPVDVSESPDSHGDSEPSHIIIRALTVMPKKDDDALIAFDNRRQPWVVCWWPK